MIKQHNRVWSAYASHFAVKRNSPESAPTFTRTFAAPAEKRVIGVIGGVQANAPSVKRAKINGRMGKRIICR